MNPVPVDPIDFVVREKWITITVIGSVFTFAMLTKFRENIFEPILVYVLPPESFNWMKVDLPDEGPHPNVTNMFGAENYSSYTINFGPFVREVIVWIFMILILYMMRVFLNWPTIPGGTNGAAVLFGKTNLKK